MKTAYPAIIHSENDEFWVAFPDLDGCFSDGETLADAASNASEALGMYLCSMMERNLEIPHPSDVRSICSEDGIVTVVATEPLAYRKSTKSIKKTLTIPEWLNIEAEKRHINFSSVLQQALIASIE